MIDLPEGWTHVHGISWNGHNIYHCHRETRPNGPIERALFWNSPDQPMMTQGRTFSRAGHITNQMKKIRSVVETTGEFPYELVLNPIDPHLDTPGYGAF